jgi:hypothetical protein
MLKTLTTFAFVMLTLSACSSSATLARRDTLGGRVALQGAYMPAMADARMVMVEHCQGRYEYIELGHTVEFRCKVSGARPGAAPTKGETQLTVASTSKSGRGL